MSDAVTLHSLAASFARLEETLAAQRAAERAADKKERQEERAADKKEIDEKLAAIINELRGIKDMQNKAEEDKAKAEEEKAKAKKEREDAEARMWQGLKDGLYATFLSQFAWTHKGGGFCNDTRMKAE